MSAVPTRLRVLYGDTDQMGIVYYANYLRWFEAGRNELIRARGMTYRQIEDRGLMLPVVEAVARYHASAFYDDVVEISTRVAEVGRARVRFEYDVVVAGDAQAPAGTRRAPKELLATGSTTHACLDRESRKPARIPRDIAERLRP